MKQTVLFGFLGSKRDAGEGADRWKSWRPTLALGMYEDLKVDRLELFYQSNESPLLHRIIADFREISPETVVKPNLIDFVDPWDFEEVYGKLFDFARSCSFDSDTEDYLIHIKTGTHAAQICLFLLTESRYLPGRLLQTFPPSPDSTERKPVGTYKIIDLDLSKYEQIASRFALDRSVSTVFLKSGIETKNEAFNRLIEEIEWIAIRSLSPILLTGGTGVGKSQLAERIFELKKHQGRLQGRFVPVNSAVLRDTHAMSTLFGHKKGAFTGAEKDRDGLLRKADGGLLFLDEIGELGLDEQAMLLRAIENRTFLPVGSDDEISSDFQLIAATNRDLTADVLAGKFREDLLARINLWTFRLPGLAERREDIEPNVEYELRNFSDKSGQNMTFAKDARQRFLEFARSNNAVWKANFRDLNAAIIRMATLSRDGRIRMETVEQEVERLRLHWNASSPSSTQPSAHAKKILEAVLGKERAAKLDSFEAVQLAYVLKVCRESKTLAEVGRRVFQHSRMKKKSKNDTDRVRKYLAGFGLNWDNVAGEG